MAKAYKAVKLRLYPNKQQEEYLRKNIGCSRFVYNYFLDKKKKIYEETKENFSRFDCTKELTGMKKQEEYSFLKEVDSNALLYSIMYLDAAFKNFFRSPAVGYPKFKSRYNARQSFTTRGIKIGENSIVLPKIGRISARGHRDLPSAVYKSTTVSLSPSGKFFASVLVEYDADFTPVVVEEDKVLGLTFKSDCLFIDSEGNSAQMPKYFKDMSDKLAWEQQKLSRMTPGGSNYKKQKIKIARIHEYVANQRNDFIHNLTKKLADTYDLICVEDISISKMIQDIEFKNARKSILDASWSGFITILEYKMLERGKELIKVKQEETPLSRICSHCGTILTEGTSLDKKKWVCPECQTEHIKAQNTAINIREAGYKIYVENLLKE